MTLPNFVGHVIYWTYDKKNLFQIILGCFLKSSTLNHPQRITLSQYFKEKIVALEKF